MKNTTIAKFNEYKNNLDADKGTGVYYSHDFEKVENILKQGIGMFLLNVSRSILM